MISSLPAKKLFPKPAWKAGREIEARAQEHRRDGRARKEVMQCLYTTNREKLRSFFRGLLTSIQTLNQTML